MTLKELAKVLPAYSTIHVHDKEGTFSRTGNPHEFVGGTYKNHSNNIVLMACPLTSYTMEITVKEEK